MKKCKSLGLLTATLLLPFTTYAQVVLINPFTVPEGKSEEALKFWETARDFLKDQPGYVSTNLHQSITQGSTFEFVNVAVWESDTSFEQATNEMRRYFRENGIVAPKGVVNAPALYEVIRQ